MKKDIVYQILQLMLDNSPEASYKRLNPALRSTLGDCINADLPFKKDTFQNIYKDLRGGWWFGDGAGSHIGEHFYTMAVECNHASAQQSFEAFAERPAVLWEEDAKTPFRLHVGARFTWHQHFVTVTSMRKDSLVACTYKGYRNSVSGFKVGATIGCRPEYVITHSKRVRKETVLRVVKSDEGSGDREVARRFVIPYAEIVELRRTAKARLKAMCDKISKCNPAKDGDKLTKEINAAHFRHFELETIRDAFAARKDWVANQSRIDAWKRGEGDSWLDVKHVLLRVFGGRVECSNGNGVSKSAASAVLPILIARRNESLELNIRVDSFHINRIGATGVKVGCTLVPWSEIDYIAKLLK